MGGQNSSRGKNEPARILGSSTGRAGDRGLRFQKVVLGAVREVLFHSSNTHRHCEGERPCEPQVIRLGRSLARLVKTNQLRPCCDA